ncbi:MAG: Gfo/Idh/MocA family oxidoreductase, partial [Akkermansiaceae bacterium]|nr:Gfo/Idh/MocA family oxidoreductase [Akkermansiaceae bacterium]
MSFTPSRRQFLRTVSGTAAGALLPTSLWAGKKSPNDRPDIACVGVGGKGWTDSNGAAKFGNIVAFCDVQEAPFAKRRGGFVEAAKLWPKARRYTDWREMLDKEKGLDGITVSTPDHMHAPVTMTAMQLGISPYTQKPLTRTVHESRQLTEFAAKAGLATQMGNQGHSGTTYNTLVKLIQGGAIGKVTAAHAWSNRPSWPQGVDRPAKTAEVPSGLHWDLWLGVSPERPYAPDVYHPFKWRGWYDFGAGALGDMGCHIIDPVVWALGLGSPLSVRYEGPPPAKETFPSWERL